MAGIAKVLFIVVVVSAFVCNAQLLPPLSYSIAPNGAVREFESFDDIPRYWEGAAIYEGDSFSLEYELGSASLKNVNNGVFEMHKASPIDASKDWDVTARVIIDSSQDDAAIGIALISGYAQYYFRVNAKTGYGSVYQYDTASQKFTFYMGQVDSALALKGVVHFKPVGMINVLTVRKRDTSIQFVMNGEIVLNFNTSAMPRLASRVDAVGCTISDTINAAFLDMEWNYMLHEFRFDRNAFVNAVRAYPQELNMHASEWRPFIAHDGSAIYWTVYDAKQQEEIFFANRLTDSTWSSPLNIGAPLNDSNKNSAHSISYDGNYLYMWTRVKSTTERPWRGILRSTRTPIGWTVPEYYPLVGYETRGVHTEQCVSHDGSVLIVSSQREDTHGGLDLYASFLQDDGFFSVPVNMGPVLNSAFSEHMPELASDKKTLYFSSYRPGFGDLDVWVSKRLDSTWTNWSPPVNLGPTINTNGFDGYFVVHPSGKYAYLNSEFGGYTRGIVRVTLPQDEATKQLLPGAAVLGDGDRAFAIKPITAAALALLPQRWQAQDSLSVAVDSGKYFREFYDMSTPPPMRGLFVRPSDEDFSIQYGNGAARIRKSKGATGVKHELPIDASRDCKIETRVVVHSADQESNICLLLFSGQYEFRFGIVPASGLMFASLWDSAKEEYSDVVNRRAMRISTFLMNSDLKIAISKKGDRILCALNDRDTVSYQLTSDLADFAARIDAVGLEMWDALELDVQDIEMAYKRNAIRYDPTALTTANKTFMPHLNAGEYNSHPRVAPDGSAIYWINSDSSSNYRIMTAPRETDSTWGDARALVSEVTAQGYHAVVGISADGNTLFLSGVFNTVPENLHRFWTMTRTQNSWSAPVPITVQDYYNRDKFAGTESFSVDGKVIISSCERADSDGKTDLYISFLERDGSYSQPASLDSDVNTEFEETTPILASDNRTLYFSSTRPGFGTRDVWVTKRMDETWRIWTHPVNLGPAINGKRWEESFCIHPSGKYAYMSSEAPTAGIYRVTLPDDAASRNLLPNPVGR